MQSKTACHSKTVAGINYFERSSVVYVSRMIRAYHTEPSDSLRIATASGTQRQFMGDNTPLSLESLDQRPKA
jgi:hypothetical protein